MQQLLLSLGKHWLFVFFRKISPVIQVHTMFRLQGPSLTGLKMAHQIDFLVLVQADDHVSLLDHVLIADMYFQTISLFLKRF